MKKCLLISLFSIFMFTSTVLAEQALNLHVGQIFAESASTAGFYPAEGLKDCKWDIIYIDLSKEAGQAQFKLLISSKKEKWTLMRVDYKKQEDGTCVLTSLHAK